MEKRVILFGLACFLASLMLAQFVSAAACSLDVSVINQDPYPAIPGEYVKVVFKITGVENPDCKSVSFEVKEKFPFTLNPGTSNPISINAGTYNSQYSSYYLAPYDIRVSEDALNGNNKLEVELKSSTSAGATPVAQLKDFDINVEDSIADFEVFIKDYKPATNIMTLEILNIGENDVQAVTIEIPKQHYIEIKGPNRNIVGDIDSNEYTTADFEATSDGGNILLNVYYTDSIDVRRNITKTIFFDPAYFEGRAADAGTTSGWTYLVILLIIVGASYWGYKKYKARKHKKLFS